MSAPRRLTAGDAARLAAHLLSSEDVAWTFEALAAPGVVALADTDAADGLIVLRIVADEAEILDLGVRPAARRKGLGRSLLAAAEVVAVESGTRRIILEVAVDNAPARALYAASGYEGVGERPAYYQRPDGTRADALILAKPLAS